MKNIYLSILILLVIFSSCKKSTPEIAPSTVAAEALVKPDPLNDISLEMALSIARVYKVPASVKVEPGKAPNRTNPSFPIETTGKQKNTLAVMTNEMNFATKSIGKYFSVKDADGNSTMHVINYEGGGFIIVSATKLEHTILAYSDESSFPQEILSKSHPVNFWVTGLKAKVKALRIKAIKNTDSIAVKAEWKKYTVALKTYATSGLKTNSISTPYRPYCENGYWDPTYGCVSCDDGYTWDGSVCQPPPPCLSGFTVGPLVQTLWSQDCGFNAYTPSTGNSSLCNHAPVGCEATAIGQVMKYWHAGNIYLVNGFMRPGANGTYGFQFYDYSDYAMPLYYGATENARLLADIGAAVYMDYGDNSSGANPNHENFFTNAGYSSDVRDYNYNKYDVFTDTYNGWPVMLGGFTYSFWPWGGDGHEWVCDGVSGIPLMCYPNNWDGYLMKVHLNWGWGGYCNGWYDPGYWVPNDGTQDIGPRFLHGLQEVVGIHR